MKQLLGILFILLFSTSILCAQKVDTLDVPSFSMNKTVKSVIILPENYSKDKSKSYPVIYLLHGFGDNYSCWLRIKPNLGELATKENLIFVCPDGSQSWYWDSPVDPKSKYDTFVSKELVTYIDRNYNTIDNRKGRAIAGLSMGGHGALWLSLNHKDVFGACGSMSGGVDIRPFPESWSMKSKLGNMQDNPKIWDEYTVINNLYRIKNKDLAMIIDCGTGDFFYKVNLELHEKLNYFGIDHDFISRPGAHNHSYWKNAIDYQIRFFRNFFDLINTK